MSSKKTASKHAISVSVRIKPSLVTKDDCSSSVKVEERSGRCGVAVGNSWFSYPANVICGSDQNDAYDALVVSTGLLESLRQWYSCTILAYGQTGSGKTFTMFGPTGSLTESALGTDAKQVPVLWGLFPRTALAILQFPDLTSMHASAVEVYQDIAFDLLNDHAPLKVGSARPFKLHRESKLASGFHPVGCYCRKCFERNEQSLSDRKDMVAKLPKAKGIHGHVSTHKEESEFETVGETLWPLQSPVDIAKLARTVEVTRSAQGHALNARSSRSHCLIRLHISRKSLSTSSSSVVRQQFLFVDLAGSERTKKSGTSGVRFSEATKINASLSTLGRVIRRLSEQAHHVPYRDSTLTMLLRSAFGGKSCTSVAINIASDTEHTDESTCSMKFGKRMTVVRNKATVVTGKDAKDEVAELLGAKIDLENRIAQMQKDGLSGHFGPVGTPSERKTFTENVAKLDVAKRELLRLKGELVETKGGKKKTTLQTRVIKTEEQVRNLNDIVLRQKSIRGMWVAPAPMYEKQCAELKALEDRLRLYN